MHLGRVMSVAVGAAAVLALGSGCSNADASPCDDGIDHRMSVLAFDLATGAQRWSQTDLHPYANGYTHLDGGAVVVTGGGSTGEAFDAATGARSQPPTTIAGLYDINPTRSTEAVPDGIELSAIWDGPVQAGELTVAVSGGREGNGDLVAWDRSGSTRWSAPLDRGTHSAPLVHGDTVVISTADYPPSCG